MKRVLVIAYYWPPSGGSGVQRWVKFVKYLPSEGWEPVVFAPRGADYPIRDNSLNAEVPASVEVLRGRIWEPYAAYRQLLGGKDASTQVTEISSGKKTVKQKLALWIRANLFVPDPRVSWVKPNALDFGFPGSVDPDVLPEIPADAVFHPPVPSKDGTGGVGPKHRRINLHPYGTGRLPNPDKNAG